MWLSRDHLGHSECSKHSACVLGLRSWGPELDLCSKGWGDGEWEWPLLLEAQWGCSMVGGHERMYGTEWDPGPGSEHRGAGSAEHHGRSIDGNLDWAV
jgi:hypothetical protein